VAGFQLLLGWGLVFIYAAISIGMTENWEEAIQFLKEGVLFGLLSGVGLFWLLARPIIRQGKWLPLLGKVKKD
jgi:Kef-type K+ transport system membrane component KefB